MVKTLKKIFKRNSEDLVGIVQENNSKEFVLSYGKNEIGWLIFFDGSWIFNYSQWFRNQSRLLPILEFPDKERVYRSEELWSFFSSRIPSAKQPKRLEFSQGKADQNEAVLLEFFGKQTVNNPFILELKK